MPLTARFSQERSIADFPVSTVAGGLLSPRSDDPLEDSLARLAMGVDESL